MEEIQVKIKERILSTLNATTYNELSIKHLDSLILAMDSVHWLVRDVLKFEASGNK